MARLGKVAEDISGEALVPFGGAVEGGEAGQIVVGGIARLLIVGINRVGDGKLAQRPIGVPREVPDYRLTTHIEIIPRHTAGIGIGSESVGIAGTKRHRCGRTEDAITRAGNGVLGAAADRLDPPFAVRGVSDTRQAYTCEHIHQPVGVVGSARMVVPPRVRRGLIRVLQIPARVIAEAQVGGLGTGTARVSLGESSRNLRHRHPFTVAES